MPVSPEITSRADAAKAARPASEVRPARTCSPGSPARCATRDARSRSAVDPVTWTTWPRAASRCPTAAKLAPARLALAALPVMQAQGHGRIVTITSLGGKVSVPHLLPYSTAKFAAVGFSDGLRAELARPQSGDRHDRGAGPDADRFT